MMSRLRHHNTIYFMGVHILSKKKKEYQMKNTHFMKIITYGAEGRVRGLEIV